MSQQFYTDKYDQSYKTLVGGEIFLGLSKMFLMKIQTFLCLKQLLFGCEKFKLISWQAKPKLWNYLSRIFKLYRKKSRKRETMNLLACKDSKTNTKKAWGCSKYISSVVEVSSCSYFGILLDFEFCQNLVFDFCQNLGLKFGKNFSF